MPVEPGFASNGFVFEIYKIYVLRKFVSVHTGGILTIFADIFTAILQKFKGIRFFCGEVSKEST